jgi:hypothetical protein
VPAEYRIDWPNRLIRVHLWGEVTPAESTENRRRLLSDPAFNPDFWELIDMRDVTSFGKVSSTDVKDDASLSFHFGPETRRALVAASGIGYGMARMWAVYREANGGKEQIQVFRSVEAAEAWLGVKVSN